MGKMTKTEWSWAMYDWANSVYATIIMAAVFPIYFSSVAKSAGVQGDVNWGYATSAATLVIALAAPLLGAVGDFRGMKKKLFSGFLALGVVFTFSMALTDNWTLMLVGYAVSYVGFAGSCLFTDSFLTDVTTPERMDAVSAKGFALGYIGGSTIPFLISIALIMFGESFGIKSDLAVKLSVMLTSAWWLVFSIPFLRNVKQTHYVEKTPGQSGAAAVFRNLGHTLRDIARHKTMRVFILAYFFYIDGVGSVIHMATAYGSTLGLGSTGMILALLVTQLVAVPFSLLFARVAGKIGAVRVLLIGIGVYLVVCLTGFYMGFSLEPKQADYAAELEQNVRPYLQGAPEDFVGDVLDGMKADMAETDFSAAFSATLSDAAEAHGVALDTLPIASAVLDDVLMLGSSAHDGFRKALSFSGLLFWILAALVGTSQGGMQALSRSYFGKLVPPSRSNEFFGFYEIFGRMAAVMGPAMYALVASLTGRSSFGVLSLSALFLVGGGILLAGRRTLSPPADTLQRESTLV